MLSCQILCRTEIRIHILIAVIGDKGDILRIVLIQRNTHLEISVYRTVQDVRSPRVRLIRLRIQSIGILVIEYMLPVGIRKHLTAKSAVL